LRLENKCVVITYRPVFACTNADCKEGNKATDGPSHGSLLVGGFRVKLKRFVYVVSSKRRLHRLGVVGKVGIRH
jgi:hypothetical protein